MNAELELNAVAQPFSGARRLLDLNHPGFAGGSAPCHHGHWSLQPSAARGRQK